MSCTVWDFLTALTKYDGSETAHEDVVKTLKSHGHSAKMSDAWCTETMMAALYDAGGIDLVGGYAQTSGTLKKNAQKKGIYHSGTSGILPGDILVFGTASGKPNHTEANVGYYVDVAGNYNGGCGRRSYKGRSVIGYVRPKYKAMGAMDNLQATIGAVDCILDVYGSGKTRVNQLSVFGNANAKKIQDEVDRVWGNSSKIAFDMAVYIIAGHAGKGSYRKKRLGKYATSAQNKVEEIYSLRGKTIEQAAQLVLEGKFGTMAVRELLLKFCGYSAAKVQAKVNELLAERQKSLCKVRLYIPRFWENDPDKYFGDQSIFLQYGADGKTIKKVVMFDTGMSGSYAVNKAQKLGITHIDAIVVTHDHSDHMGLTKTFVNTFNVGTVYFPNQDGVRKYQPSYAKRMDELAKYCAQKGVEVDYLNPGEAFSEGDIVVKCIFQADASKLPEKDDHHFINNMSAVYKVTIGKWRILIGGDLSADGIKQMIAAGVDFACDVFKFFWHSDRGAITTAFAKLLKGVLIAYTQYHSKESSGNGRKSTHNLLRDIGAVVVRVCEEGEIDMVFESNTLTLTTASGIRKVFTK